MSERRPLRDAAHNDHATEAEVINSVTEALGIARAMAEAGIPVFCAYPDPEGKTESGRATGYSLPGGWQKTTPNPALVGAWKPGMALCAVMGYGLDLVDVDPRNGGEIAALNGTMPDVYGMATSPSGGYHFLVGSMGVGSRDKVLTGIDVKAGTGDGGADHGFAFLAPTIRKSKTTGEPGAYKWVKPPDLTRLGSPDTSGEKLSELVRQARGSKTSTRPSGQLFQQPDGTRREHTGPIYAGDRHDALISYAGWLLHLGVPIREAEACMLQRLGDCLDVHEDGTRSDKPAYTEAEALGKLRDIYGRYEAGDPAAASTRLELPDYDLGEIVAQGVKEPERIAGGMLYRGGMHCLAGQPGGGKTTIVAWWMLQHIRDGGRVMLLDEESGPEMIAEKFLDLGAKASELRSPNFTYIPFPSRSWTLADITQLHARIEERKPDIVAWDSAAAFLAIGGYDENAAADVTRFWQRVLIPCARIFGAAVVGVDHTGKNPDHGGYGRGSGAKKAASDVQYIVETITPFNRTTDGLLKVTTSPGKDRRGWLPMGYEIIVRIGPPMTLEVSETAGGTDRKDAPAKLKLLAALTSVATLGNPKTGDQLVDEVKRVHGHGLSRPTWSKHLNELVAEGLADCIDPGIGRAKLWFPPPVNLSPTRKGDIGVSVNPPYGVNDDDRSDMRLCDDCFGSDYCPTEPRRE